MRVIVLAQRIHLKAYDLMGVSAGDGSGSESGVVGIDAVGDVCEDVSTTAPPLPPSRSKAAAAIIVVAMARTELGARIMEQSVYENVS